MENKKNIWLDTDPGIDDAVAFAVLIANRDKVNICGISSVAGNQTSDRVTINALKLTEFLGADDIPVVRGAREPLLREPVDAGEIHGKSGLGYLELPEPEKKVAAENGIPYMRDVIMTLPEGEKMTIMPVGPLTNIALLFKTFPEVKERVEEIVLMGGAAVGGNITPTAEFNIWEDPEAAKIVFSSGVPIVMCGLDVTHQCGLTRQQVKELRESTGRVQHAYGEMLTFYFDSPAYENSDRVYIHDATTAIYIIYPELFGGRKMRVDVDCSEGMNRGMTVCDMRIVADEGSTEGGENVLVLNQADFPAYQKILLDVLASYDH